MLLAGVPVNSCCVLQDELAAAREELEQSQQRCTASREEAQALEARLEAEAETASATQAELQQQKTSLEVSIVRLGYSSDVPSSAAHSPAQDRLDLFVRPCQAWFA